MPLSQIKSEERISLVKRGETNGLYGILRLNEFDVEDKTIRRLRLFKRGFPWIFGDRLFPTHEISLLLSGEEPPLITIHDFLVQEPSYLVLSAKDVERANWFAETREAEHRLFVTDYIGDLKLHLEEDFKELDAKIILNNQGGGYYSAIISSTGSVEQTLKLRKELRTGFRGMTIKKDKVSYS